MLGTRLRVYQAQRDNVQTNDQSYGSLNIRESILPFREGLENGRDLLDLVYVDLIPDVIHGDAVEVKTCDNPCSS